MEQKNNPSLVGNSTKKLNNHLDYNIYNASLDIARKKLLILSGTLGENTPSKGGPGAKFPNKGKGGVQSPLLDSFLQFLFYKEYLLKNTNESPSKFGLSGAAWTTKGVSPYGRSNFGEIRNLQKNLTLPKIQKRPVGNTVFFPYGKSFLCYWLIPFMGFISFSPWGNSNGIKTIENQYVWSLGSGANSSLPWENIQIGSTNGPSQIGGKNSHWAPLIYSDYLKTNHYLNSGNSLLKNQVPNLHANNHSAFPEGGTNFKPWFYVLENYIENLQNNNLVLSNLFLPPPGNNQREGGKSYHPTNSLVVTFRSLENSPWSVKNSGLFSRNGGIMSPRNLPSNLEGTQYYIPGLIRANKNTNLGPALKGATSKQKNKKANLFAPVGLGPSSKFKVNTNSRFSLWEKQFSSKFNQVDNVFLGVSNIWRSKEQKLNNAAQRAPFLKEGSVATLGTKSFLTNPVFSYKKASLLLDTSIRLAPHSLTKNTPSPQGVENSLWSANIPNSLDNYYWKLNNAFFADEMLNLTNEHTDKISQTGVSLGKKIDFLDKVILPLLRNNLNKTTLDSNQVASKLPSSGTSDGGQSFKELSREQLYKIIISALPTQGYFGANQTANDSLPPDGARGNQTIFNKKLTKKVLASSNTLVFSDVSKAQNINNGLKVHSSKGSQTKESSSLSSLATPVVNLRKTIKTQLDFGAALPGTQKVTTPSLLPTKGMGTQNRNNQANTWAGESYLNFLTNTLQKNCSLYLKNSIKTGPLSLSKSNLQGTETLKKGLNTLGPEGKPTNTNFYNDKTAPINSLVYLLSKRGADPVPFTLTQPQKIFRSYLSTKKGVSSLSRKTAEVLSSPPSKAQSGLLEGKAIWERTNNGKLRKIKSAPFEATTNIGGNKEAKTRILQKMGIPLRSSTSKALPYLEGSFGKNLETTVLGSNSLSSFGRGGSNGKLFASSKAQSGLQDGKSIWERKNNLTLTQLFKNRAFIVKSINQSNTVAGKTNLLNKGEGPNFENPPLEETLYFNNLIRRKYQQKKYKRKKQIKETRRKKKRKRFYPRPTWLRFRLYTQLCIKLTKNKSSFPSGTTDKATYKAVGARDERTNFAIKGAVKRYANDFIYTPTNDFYKPFFVSSNFDQISQTVLTELKRSFWKSYWLRSNLKPYLNRVKKHLNEMKQVKTKWEFYNITNTLISYFFGLNEITVGSNNETMVQPLNYSFNKWLGTASLNGAYNLQLLNNTGLEAKGASSLNGLGKGAKLLEKPPKGYANMKNFFYRAQSPIVNEPNASNMLGAFDNNLEVRENAAFSNSNPINKWQLITQISEYNRIMYQRVNNLILNIKENLDINGQPKARAYHIGHKKIVPWNLTALKTAGPGDGDKNQPGQNDFWVKLASGPFGATVSNLTSKKDRYYGDFDKFRLYWAMHKTNTGSYKKVNKRKDLWITLKNREQRKSNKTKKMFNSIIKKFGNFSTTNFQNSSLSYRNKDQGLLSNPYSEVNQNKLTTPIQTWVRAQSNASLLNRIELALKLSERKLRQKEEKLAYLGFGADQFRVGQNFGQKTSPFNSNQPKKASLQSREAQNISQNFNKFTTDFNYWWNPVVPEAPKIKGGPIGITNFVSGTAIYNYDSSFGQGAQSLTEVNNGTYSLTKEKSVTIPLWVSTFLFHFCAIVSLISISQIRDAIKFSLIVFSKFSQIYLYLVYNTILVPFQACFPEGRHQKTKQIGGSSAKRSSTKWGKASLVSGNATWGKNKGAFGMPFSGTISSASTKPIFVKLQPHLGVPYKASFPPFWEGPNNFYGSLIKTEQLDKNNLPLATERDNNNSLLLGTGGNKKEKQYMFFVLLSLVQKFFKSPKLSAASQKGSTQLSTSQNKNKLVTLSLIYFYSTLNTLLFLSSTITNSLYSAVLTLVNNVLVVIRSMYTFLEKPGELIIDWMAYAFLVEWSSDLTNTIPDTIDTSIYNSIYKYSRVARANVLLMPFAGELGMFPLGGGAIPGVQNSLWGSQGGLAPLPTEWGKAPLVSGQATWGGPNNIDQRFDESLLSGSSNPGGALLSFAVVFGGARALQRHFIHLYEIFLRIACQPDTDLLVRQQKGRIFWDIWSDLLVDVAEDSNINISELSNLQEEQNRLLEKLLAGGHTNNAWNSSKTGTTAIKKEVKTLSAAPEAGTNLNNSKKGPLKEAFQGPMGLTKKLKWKNISTPWSNATFAGGNSLTNNESKNRNLRKSTDWWNTKDKLLLRWSTSQFLSYQGKDTELFIDLHPPKSLNSVFRSLTSIKYSQSIQQPIGIIMCQIFSGIFSKQIAKNLLVVGSSGTEKSLLIQALAGETENQIITDNAYRYAIVFRGVAVGIKLLRDVFEALTLHTPCIFLLEDIHAIGERRPFLISDDSVATQTSKASDSAFGSERDADANEKNQVIYQLTKHIISHYKKPYKGDFSLLIPTNYFSFELFSNVTNTKGGNRSALMNGARTTLKANPLLTNMSNSGKNSPSFGAGGKENTNSSNKGQFKASSLELSKNQLLAPPATSPFSVLVLKEEKKLKPKSLVKELPWIGLPGEQLANVNKANYSIRVKIALLADMVLSNLSVKLDMITDLLVIIDSVKGNRGFVVFATTHVPYILDPALRRPGRFDETISLPQIPTILTRWEILKSNLANLVGGAAQPLVSTYGGLRPPFYAEAEPILFGSPKLATIFASQNDQFNTPSVWGGSAWGMDFLNIYQNIHNLSSNDAFVKNPYNLGGSPLGGGNNSQNNKDNFGASQSTWNSLILNAISTTILNRYRRKGNKLSKDLTLTNNKGQGQIISPIKKIYNRFSVSSGNVTYLTPTLFTAPLGQTRVNAKANKLVSGENKDLQRGAFPMGGKEAKFMIPYSAPTLYNNSQVSTILRSKVYNIVSKFLINKILFANRVNLLSEDSLNYTILFSSGGLGGKADIFKQHLTILLGGKIGELFTYSGTGFTPKGSQGLGKSTNAPKGGNFAPAGEPIPQGLMSLYGIDQAWRTATALIYSFIQKRWIYQKNLLVPKFLDFGMRSATNNGITEIPSPPISNILLPAKRYENFKRTFYLKQHRSPSNPNGNDLTINEQIQVHQQQRLVKRLYKVPLKEFFRSEFLNTQSNAVLQELLSLPGSGKAEPLKGQNETNLNGLSFTSFSNASIILSPLEKNQQKPTKMNWFFRNRILNRHHTYLSNQWWNGQLQEHNPETTLSSDIDWRYSFIEKIGDIFIDFPDADQFYVSQNRRWLNTNNSWSSWFDYDQSIYQEYYSHYIYECLINAYKCLDQNRELLDYYVISVLEKGAASGQNLESLISQLEIFSILKRFSSISNSDK